MPDHPNDRVCEVDAAPPPSLTSDCLFAANQSMVEKAKGYRCPRLVGLGVVPGDKHVQDIRNGVSGDFDARGAYARRVESLLTLLPNPRACLLEAW